MNTPLKESQVHSAYLDSDGSLHLYDEDENTLEGWPVGWPEEIKSVKRFLECRQINYVNRPRGMTALEKIMAESVHKDEELTKLRRINARRVFDYIERICEVCGHTRGHDDPECPNCLKRAITELNQRLIDRTESHTAQTIRIEDTWREKLRESQAQVVALRDALTQYREAFSDGPENCGCILWEKVDEIAAAALSCPPPPCVPLAEAQSLADALQSLRDEQNGPPLERHKIHWQEAYDTATRLLNEWDAKHPQPQTA